MNMQPPSWRSIGALLMIGGLSLAAPAAGAAKVSFSVGPFRSLTVRSGGVVTLRHGSTQRVTLLDGDEACASVTIEDGDRLVIEPSERHCGDPDELYFEVVTPDIDGILVSDGGTVRAAGDFPSQTKLTGAVENGGTIDIRALKADDVHASVRQGGGILTRPQRRLMATVSQGGIITYWGNPEVKSSVDHRGDVSRGKAADFGKPLDEFGLGPLPPAPPVPPVPPVPPIGN